MDDPPTLKFVDDGGGKGIDTNPSLDPVKLPSLDKNPGSDRKLPGLDENPGLPPGGRFGGPRFGREFGTQGASPFILATPHHSTAYLGGDPQEARAQYEEAIGQIQQQLAQLQEASQYGSFGPAEQQQAQALQAQYQQLVQQYQMMFSGLPGQG